MGDVGNRDRGGPAQRRPTARGSGCRCASRSGSRAAPREGPRPGSPHVVRGYASTSSPRIPQTAVRQRHWPTRLRACTPALKAGAPRSRMGACALRDHVGVALAQPSQVCQGESGHYEFPHGCSTLRVTLRCRGLSPVAQGRVTASPGAGTGTAAQRVKVTRLSLRELQLELFTCTFTLLMLPPQVTQCDLP